MELADPQLFQSVLFAGMKGLRVVFALAELWCRGMWPFLLTLQIKKAKVSW